jgi:hypothetical protein
MGALLAMWKVGGWKKLPARQFRQLRFGWGLQQEARLMMAMQLAELLRPLTLAPTVRRLGCVRVPAFLPFPSSVFLYIYVAFASVLCVVPGREAAGSPMVAYVVPTATCSVRNNAPVKEVRKPNPVDSEIVLIVTRPVISHGMAGGALFAQWRGCVGSSMRRTG